MQDTFIVSIVGREAYTWQGTIKYQGNIYHFNSELELLLSIQRLLEGDVFRTQFNEEKESIV